jgi:DNA-binding transcriptional MerR regulator
MADDQQQSTDGREYTIDELAAVSGVPSRTIRYYQSAGALPHPVIRGRVAYYSDVHVARLELVADLQDRGLRIKAIRDLLAKIESKELDLHQWLGLDAQIGTAWSEDRPRVCSTQELYELAGSQRRGLLADLVRLRLADRQGKSFLVHSPRLLRIAIELERAGVDLETAYGGAAIIRKHASRAAKDLAKYFFKRASEGFGHDASSEELLEAFRAVRPMGQEALQLIFAQEMDRVVRELVEMGKTTELPKRKRKRRR